MRKLLLVGTLLALPLLVQSQTEKGVTPIAGTQSGANGATWAVVVGISDYQDPGIPDLHYADKDAEAFANFLRSPSGGGLNGDHLKLLLNKEATMAQFAAALDWLWEVTKEGDQAIIYFSGHGDVEKKSLTQPGFLLCWDAPARVYMGGGAFALPMLQEVISTLSIQNKAKVVVITDACRSGALAGNSVGGAQATAANLAKQYANEIKILSCQPNEYSIEGAQWGGGRGAFSYNLVNALYGLADANNDKVVTLQEVGRYLEDHVTAEVAPVSQIPMVMGNRSERMAIVEPDLLTALRAGKTDQMAMLSPVDSRGMEDDVLAGVDTTVREMYHLFKKALKNKLFLEPANACADAWYEQLMAEPKLARLHSSMRRNYAAALQDEAQQVMNEWLKTDQSRPLLSDENNKEGRMSRIIFTEKVRAFPRCLERAAELLGKDHYMYATLQARKNYFIGYLIANSNRNPDKEVGDKALAAFRTALQWQPELPQAYWQMSKVFGYNLQQSDSMAIYARRASELYPNWLLPYMDAAYLFSHTFKQYNQAKKYLDQANRIDSSSATVAGEWGNFEYFQKQYEAAEQYYKKAIALDSTDADNWNNLEILYFQMGRYEEAEPVLKKAISLDSTEVAYWNNYGNLCSNTRRYPEAERHYQKAIALDSTYASPWNNLGYLYFQTGRYPEAEQHYQKAISQDSGNVNALANLGGLYNRIGRFAEAIPVFIKAIALDSSNVNAWNNLGYSNLQTAHYPEAAAALQKAILLNPNIANPRRHLAMVDFKTGRPDEARAGFLKAIELNPNYAPALLGMAYLLAAEGKTAEALSYVEQAIQKKVTFGQLNMDEDLAALRSTAAWKDLLKQYFPDQVKD